MCYVYIMETKTMTKQTVSSMEIAIAEINEQLELLGANMPGVKMGNGWNFAKIQKLQNKRDQLVARLMECDL
jgi:hypothetical protein